jgi:hypothetical protein
VLVLVQELASGSAPELASVSELELASGSGTTWVPASGLVRLLRSELASD